MVGGRLYSTGGTRRAVVALDAATGELLWVHSEDEGARGAAAPRQLSGRGLAYWSDGKEERILYVTPGYRLVALDAKTGNPVAGFGRNGIVDLKADFDPTTRPDHGAGRAPRHADRRRQRRHRRRRVRDRRQSEEPAQREGRRPRLRRADREAAVDVQDDSGAGRGRERDVGERFVGVHRQHRRVGADLRGRRAGHGLPAGGAADARLLRRRAPGKRLFGESLVAVDYRTGERKWHFQLVHHGIWDMDIPCAPILADIRVNGRTIKAVAQPTKQAFLYVFDRVTGQPIWPIEERPVPQGDMPGEKYSPTQPFPTQTRRLRSAGAADRRSDRLHAGAARRSGEERSRGTGSDRIFTPPVVSKAEGPIATLAMATQAPATNWPGGSYDPETHILYVQSQSAGRDARPRSAACGRRRRRALSPGHGADGRAAHRRVRFGHRAGRRRGDGADRSGAAAHQAAVRPHQRHRPRYRRHPLAGAARRDARRDPQSSGAEGAEHSAHRPSGQRRHARHEDAASSPASRASARRRRASAARCCAPTTSAPAPTPAPSTCRRRRPDRR